MKNITEAIECDMTHFLDYAHDLSYTELIAMERLLEAEHFRILELRKHYETVMSQLRGKLFHTKSVRSLIESYQPSYITTFVFEQKITDRLGIVERLKKSKGVDPAIFRS